MVTKISPRAGENHVNRSTKSSLSGGSGQCRQVRTESKDSGIGLSFGLGAEHLGLRARALGYCWVCRIRVRV